MINHFKEFNLEEMVDAYAYFTEMQDYEGCRMVADAFDSKTSINLVNFSIQ